MSLPAGLNPVEAGRLGLWLLSRRSRSNGQRRRHPHDPRGAARDSASASGENLTLDTRFGGRLATEAV